jgi:hypothetical protein
MNTVSTKAAAGAGSGNISGTNASTQKTVTFPVTSLSARRPANPSDQIERAVYAYLRVVRSLGRKHIRPEDVASALGISATVALVALTALRDKGDKGVKLSK